MASLVNWDNVFAPAKAPQKTAVVSATKTAPSKSLVNWDDVFNPTPKPVLNKFGEDVSGHAMNPLNPNNQINQPQPKVNILKQTFNPSNLEGAVKTIGNDLYDKAGQIVAPGITHEELRDPQILKDTVEGLIPAAGKIIKQTAEHPIQTTTTAVRSAAKGISDTITDGIINVTVPKEDREATKAQVQATLSKYLGTDSDYSNNPTLEGISEGFHNAGASAPFIAAGGIGGDAAGMAGFTGANAMGASLETAANVIKYSQIAGNTAGFLAAGQTQVPLEATVRQRSTQLMNDLVGLGLFTVGSEIFGKVKSQATDLIRKSLTENPPTPVTSIETPKPSSDLKTMYQAQAKPEAELPKASRLENETPATSKVIEAFNKSSDQVPIKDNFELGTFGRNNAEKKIATPDRFPEAKLAETIDNIKNSYRASDNPNSYRYENTAHIAEMPDGEKRVIYTRQNANGRQEIINWHKVNETKNPNYLSTLESYGSPTGIRTQIAPLEAGEPVRLTDRTKDSIPQPSENVNPLTQEAKKYKSADEFVKNYDGGLILDRQKINDWISGGPDNTRPVSELLGPEGKKFMQENNLPDIPVKVQEAGEETIGYHAQIQWRGGNKLKDAQINIEISPTEEFGVEDLAGMEKNLLHELSHAKQITLNRLGNKKIQGTISEQSAEKHANYALNKAKSQLTDIWNKANETKAESPKTTSKIAQSINQKAVDAKLTEGFSNVAGYDKINLADQAKRATDLINNNLDEARSIIRGEKPLPEGLKGTALITAMEEQIKANPNADLAYELANSPLITGTSEAAQELRLAAEREPDSAAAKLAEMKKALVEKAGGDKVVAKKKASIFDELKKETTKVNLTKDELSWEKFINEITC